MFIRIAAPIVLGIAAVSGCAENPNTQPPNNASVKNAPIPDPASPSNSPESPREELRTAPTSGPMPSEPKVEEKKQPGGGK
ncbi:MAG: hypothetical protein HOO96_33445 [Polyangiaceae bacterium]|nr:hypothetical protein [Polyangiaceae bacterium]